jgi:hypothetical protein
MYLDFISRTTQPQPPTSPAVVPRRASYWSRAPTPGTRRPSTRPRWASRAAATPARARCRGAWGTSAMGCRHGEIELLGMTSRVHAWCCKDCCPVKHWISEHEFGKFHPRLNSSCLINVECVTPKRKYSIVFNLLVAQEGRWTSPRIIAMPSSQKSNSLCCFAKKAKPIQSLVGWRGCRWMMHQEAST